MSGWRGEFPKAEIHQELHPAQLPICPLFVPVARLDNEEQRGMTADNSRDAKPPFSSC